jgi:RHS repeat-associated protein
MCRLQIPGGEKFGDPQEIHGVNKFQSTSTRTNNWGVEASLYDSIGAGASWSDTRSNTSIYLTDVNSDGLPDIIDNGSVYLNRGDLNFDNITDGTVINIGGTCDGDVFDFSGEVNPTIFDDGCYTVEHEVCDTWIDSVEVSDTVYVEHNKPNVYHIGYHYFINEQDHCHTVTDTFCYTYPRCYEPDIDLVRMWIAPYRGTVRVSGQARLTDILAPYREMTHTSDGVWVSVHKASDTTHLIASAIVTPDINGQDINGETTVDEGDTIFFRMNSVDKRLYDEVEWTPHVRYTEAYLRDSSRVADLSVLDAVGDSVFAFDYGDDFMLDGIVPVSIGDADGNVCNNYYEVRMSIRSDVPLSQPVKYTLVRRDLNAAGTEHGIIIATLPVGDDTQHWFIDTIIVPSNQGLFLRLSTIGGGQVRWSSIETHDTVRLLSSSSTMLTECLADTNMRDNFVWYPAVDREYNDYLAIPSVPVTGLSRITAMQVNVVPPSFKGWMRLTVKDSESSFLVHRDSVYVANGQGTVVVPSIPLQTMAKYHIDCQASPNTGNEIEEITVRFNNGDTSCQAGLYAKYSSDDAKHHGTLYRGWGQFGYKSNDSTARFINSDLIRVPDYYTDTNAVPRPDENSINGFDTNAVLAGDSPELDLRGGTLNPLSGNFFEMRADGFRDCWVSYGDAVSASRELSTLDGEANAGRSQYAGDAGSEALESGPDMFQSPMPVVVPGQPLKAVNKMVLTKGNGFTILRNSVNYGRSRLLSDFMDLNGDGYPDVVSEKAIQYSKAQGGLSTLTRGYAVNDEGINRTNNYSHGRSFNGTFVSAQPEPKSNMKRTRTIHTTQGQSAVSVSQPSIGNGPASIDRTKNTFLDINGDGLPDIVYVNDSVRYNMGYRFTDCRYRPMSEIHISQSVSGSGGIGINIANTSISGGLSIGLSENITWKTLVDIDGDGLQDPLLMGGYIAISRGDGTYAPNIYQGPPTLDQSNSQSFSVNATITGDAQFSIFGYPLKVGGSASGGGNASLCYTKAEFIDMDNDGHVDYVYNDPLLNQVWVCYSRIGKTNMLRSVTNFAGAVYDVDYALSESSPESPRRHWDMTSITVYDGYDGDGESTLFKTIEYRNRTYNRYERDDYGYQMVTIKEYASEGDYVERDAYRVTTQEYMNSDYYHNRLKISEHIASPTDSGFVETRYTYGDADLKDGHWLGTGLPAWCEGDGWPAISVEETITKEGVGGFINTQREYRYGAYGNVTKVHDQGDINDGDDDYTVELDYALDSVNHIVANVSLLNIQGYRHRTATYTAEGSIDTLTVDNSPSPQSVYLYEYDTYGNVATVTTPAINLDSGGRYRIDYTYDSVTHSLPVSVSNSEGLTSSADYSYRWQQPLRTIDMGGVPMYYRYDSHGRVDRVVAPREAASGAPYTVKYDYWYSRRFFNPRHPTQPGFMANTARYFWARTRNYDPAHPGNDINTVTFSDGLGRIIQVKKDVESYGMETRAVGGTVHYDGLGRKLKEFFLQEESFINTSDTMLNMDQAQWQAFYTYDWRDRIVRADYADGTSTRNNYSIAPDADGIKRFLNAVTDQNGHTSYLYTDARQLNTQVTDALGGITRFNYDAVGQLITSKDPENNKTTHAYDLGGRRTYRYHPSAGQTHWEYDAAGNMTKQTQNSGDSIKYYYNYTRPVRIEYSNRPWNNVWYEYDTAGSGTSAGRLVRQQDATGVQEFRYDSLGNVNYNRHTYVQPGCQQTLTLETRWEYDSWGRVQSILYPDSEEVRYYYDRGGNVNHIEGTKPGQATTQYIKQLHYDLYGQRTYQQDGNDVETHYSYNPLNRRLDNLNDYSSRTGQYLQNINYTYDAAGNILQINDYGLNRRSQSFGYDSINRLVVSNGNANCYGNSLGYDASYNYSPAGRILTKNVSSQRINTAVGWHSVNYQNSYAYQTDNPFAINEVLDAQSGTSNWFDWDANGNMANARCGDPIQERRLCWTEDNRLQGYAEMSGGDIGIAAYYNYTAEGDRNFKITSTKLNIRQNGEDLAMRTYMRNPTLYASALITLNKNGYSKHYFEGTNRICSKIGGGFRHVDWHSIDDSVPSLYEDYETQYAYQQEGMQNTLEECIGGEIWTEGVANLYAVLKHEYGRDEAEPVFYYHSDHLGSTSYLTNEWGDVTQTLNYLPYGEDWVDLQNHFETRYPLLGVYTFNGKEKDWESGFHYYGARYYWSEMLTGWLSVDPMTDKYPSISPYAYCAWNPVKLVDPDGREMDNYLIFENGQIFKEETYDNTNKYTYIRDDGTEVDLGTYSVSQNDKCEDMVAIGNTSSGKNNHFSWLNINSGNLYFEEDAFAGLLGGIQNFYDDNTSSNIQPVRFNQLMSSNRTHSGTSNRHSAIDIAYYNSDGNPGAHADRPADHTSIPYNISLLNSLKNFGLGFNNVFTSTDPKGSSPFLGGTTALPNHHHHMHLQGFSGKVLPLLEITEETHH